MFAMNKETMMMVAIAVALVATFYLYRENQKNKLDIQRLSEVPPPVLPPVLPKPILKKEKVVAPVVTIADETE